MYVYDKVNCSNTSFCKFRIHTGINDYTVIKILVNIDTTHKRQKSKQLLQ